MKILFIDTKANNVPWIISGTVKFLLAATLIFYLATNLKTSYGAPTPPPFKAGYGYRAIPWRAGAKPGQVGTQDSQKGKFEKARLLLGALHLTQFTERPEKLLRSATKHTLITLHNRVNSIQPGKYSFYANPGKGIETPPHVRALVLSNGDKKAAIVRADTFLMHEQITHRVSELIKEDTGIGRDQLMLMGSHNHSAPHGVSAAFGPWLFADAFDPRHFVYVTHKIAEAIKMAYGNLQPATLRSCHTHFDKVQRNIIGPRKIKMESPESGHKESISVGYPHSHFDSEIAAIRIDSADNPEDTIVFLFVLGLHPETLPDGHGLISGEWPVHAEERVTEIIGAPSMSLPGPMGDIEPDRGYVNENHHFWRSGFDTLNEMSEIIAHAMAKAYETAGEKEPDTAPKILQATADIPGPCEHPMPSVTYFRDYLSAPFPTPRVIQDSSTFRLHLLTLGDMLLVGIPAETVSDLSINIKSRLGKAYDNIYQGYIFEDAPEWVRRRINQNFGSDALPEEKRVRHPVVLNFVNGHIGYAVTRWEYENRSHYRQSLTPYGPGTAEHIAASTVKLASHMFANTAFQPEMPDWHETDHKGFEEIRSFLATIDDEVRKHAMSFPAFEPQEVGRVVEEPAFDALNDKYVQFRFKGGTNDIAPPQVAVEAKGENGWVTIAHGPGRDLLLLYESPNIWTACWLKPEAQAGKKLRFRAGGQYRSKESGSSETDPIWDPHGANHSYEVESRIFTP